MDNNFSQPSPQSISPEPGKKLHIKLIVTIVVVLTLTGATYGGHWWWQNYRIPAASEIKDFESCFRYVHGHTQIFVSHCQAPDGKIFENPSWTSRLLNEIKDWKTYRNKQYGFEFKYPTDKFLVNPSDSIDYENTVLVSKTETGQPGILIITAAKKSSENDMFCEEEIGEITIAGTEIKKCRASEPDDRWFGFLSGSEADFRFDCWFPTQNDSICVQILSTFKFIEPEICIQIITPARNPETGELRDFPTPCDVPEGWEVIK